MHNEQQNSFSAYISGYIVLTIALLTQQTQTYKESTLEV